MTIKNKKVIKNIKDNFFDVFKSSVSDEVILKVVQHEVQQKKISYLKHQLSHLDMNHTELNELSKYLLEKTKNNQSNLKKTKRKITKIPNLRSKMPQTLLKKTSLRKTENYLLNYDNQPLLFLEKETKE